MTAKSIAICGLLSTGCLLAETGRDAWLRYEALLYETAARSYRETLPAVVAAIGDAPEIASARQEVLRGVRGMLGRTLRVQEGLPRENAIVIGTLDALRREAPALAPGGDLAEDAFRLRTVSSGGVRYTVIAAANPRGALYGAFTLLRKIALYQPIANLDETQTPYAPVRWVNQWDNLDGSIERGYGGRSIFWENGGVRADLTRAGEYARLLASVGINACAVNNVNANPKALSPEILKQVARIADVFRPWGVRLALAVDFASPRTVGGLDTFDPGDQRVIAFWKNKADQVYSFIPDLAGFVLKADSEGRLGPSAYNKTHADAANVVARALRPHGGLFFYRGFVYNNRMDWRNPKNDRGRAAWDNFHDLDGQFDDNVIIQVKNGPIDFQVREPASPLFGALEKTNQAIELQITQEYFGQARHMVYLPTMWKEVLDFDMHANGAGTSVAALVAGKTLHRPTGGFVGVSNVGLDENWTGNHFSQANLYGYGRLAWNPGLTARQIADEWTRLTFGHNPKVVETIAAMQMSSWRTFENYTGPLGLQTLTEITGTHYGPAVEASERNGWGQWHRADEQGVGTDRTVATGTGFIGQYRPEVAKVYESLGTCPDDLLVFLHHVPYTYKLHSGKTVIQYMYDSHYDGAETAADWVAQWSFLREQVDEGRYREVLAQLEYQAGHAVVWRDSVVSWFARASGIPDALGRAGAYPGRVEAESMDLEGYSPTAATPWETASGGQAVSCPIAQCAASFQFNGAPGWYTLRVQYFDQDNGVSHYRLSVGAQTVDEWDADDHLPSRKLDGAASTRRRVGPVALRPGDQIRIEGKPGGAERAPIDYIEISPSRD
jgi:alpha-glucuronidase